MRTLKPIRASTMNLNKRHLSPSLTASMGGPGQIFNASEIGTFPRTHPSPLGVSPGPAAVFF